MTSIFEKSFANNSPAFFFDPLILLIEHCLADNQFEQLTLLDLQSFSDTKIVKAKEAFRKRGLSGILSLQFQSGIINDTIDINTERRKKSSCIKKRLSEFASNKSINYNEWF